MAEITTEDFIGEIYEAAFVPEKWEAVMERLGSFVETDKAIIFSTNGEGVGQYVATKAGTDAINYYFENNISQFDILTQKAFERRLLRFSTTHELIGVEDFERSYYYNEYARRFDIGNCYGALIQMPQQGFVSIGLHSKWDRNPPPTDKLAILDRLRPHIARSALAASRANHRQSETALQALNAIKLPACCVSGTGKLRLANDQFGKFLPGLVQDRADRLRFASREADLIFEQLLQSVGRGGHADVGTSFAVKMSGDHPPHVVHVMPVCGNSHDVFAFAQWIIVIIPIEFGPTYETHLIEGLFDITQAEADVLSLLLKGHDADEIASLRQTSINTTRSQLKSIMGKIGVSKQIDIVRFFSRHL